MNVLTTPVHDLTFADIVAFCQEQHIEGIQVDYKQDFPKKGLAKHIAAFSNTRGGIIIIGVEEDDKTGLPVKWDGIVNIGKLEDRVHQFASNVDPFPDYEVSTTNEVNGKVFLLIRIFEGDNTPYYEQNDSNTWVRTGNISTSVDIASPEYLELLFRKREKAELARSIFIRRANELFNAALRRADRERLARIADKKEKERRDAQKQGVIQNTSSSQRIYQNPLGTEAAMFTILLQPYYPGKSLIKPLKLKHSIENLQVRTRYGTSFPDYDKETIPEGVLSFRWRESDGLIECEQIYGTGLLYHAIDVLRVNEQKYKLIYLSTLARHFVVSLRAAEKYYKLIGYQGNVRGHIRLTKVEDVGVQKIIPHAWMDRFDDVQKCLLPEYQWEINTDTTVLNDAQALREYFINMVSDLYVSFNCAPPEEGLLDAFITEEQLL